MSITKKYYIETFGCQMNDRDSEIMSQLMSETFAPTTSVEDADIVLVNTCSIRQKAEHKAMSLLGTLRLIKESKNDLIIGIVGCVAQQEGQKLLQRLPFVDLVMGTQSLYNLPALLADIINNKKRIVSVEQNSEFVIPPFLPEPNSGPHHKRFITIMQGCNNFCTYCVVPFTRGREISRKFSEIVTEADHLARQGVKEITLLGQNVNSYGRNSDGKQEHTFAELLEAVSHVPGLNRLRFTTSNPKDLTIDLLECFSRIDILCSHFHLPVQSGSNAILTAMNRKYSVDTYYELIEQLRRHRSDIAITTDIIVGFPGESDNDFQATYDLVEKVRYHGAYSFKYSDRPHTKSAKFDCKVPEAIKIKRLAVLQKRIDEICLERNQEYIGQALEIMVEGQSKGQNNQWNGRTTTNHIVHFTCRSALEPGQLVTIEIDEACQNSLRGHMYD
nr:tRNA (N6-isopentenyl adenosine(37)-C2)-methylthiotransferase MiaB [Desulfobulbaceae bacterium]